MPLAPRPACPSTMKKKICLAHYILLSLACARNNAKQTMTLSAQRNTSLALLKCALSFYNGAEEKKRREGRDKQDSLGEKNDWIQKAEDRRQAELEGFSETHKGRNLHGVISSITQLLQEPTLNENNPLLSTVRAGTALLIVSFLLQHSEETTTLYLTQLFFLENSDFYLFEQIFSSLTPLPIQIIQNKTVPNITTNLQRRQAFPRFFLIKVPSFLGLQDIEMGDSVSI